MSDKKTEISEIKIKVAGKELSLSPTEARDLRNILDDLFGKEVVYHYQTVPYWPERIVQQPYQYGPWQIQCNSGTVLSLTAGSAQPSSGQL